MDERAEPPAVAVAELPPSPLYRSGENVNG